MSEAKGQLCSEADTPYVRRENEDGVATLTLDRPGSLNRLSTEEQFLELAAAIREVGSDPAVRALIVTGAGRAFCAGGDIRRMAAREGFSAGSVSDIRQRYRRSVHQVSLALWETEIPTIAAVNGAAYGAGCDLACFCDIRLAALTATFCVSFSGLGIVAGDGGAWMLPRLVGRSRAMQLAFTADPIDAATAQLIGLVSDVVAAEELLPRARTLARRIAAHPAEAMRMNKRLLRDAEQIGLSSHLDLVAAFQAIAHMSPEHLRAASAALQSLQRQS